MTDESIHLLADHPDLIDEVGMIRIGGMGSLAAGAPYAVARVPRLCEAIRVFAGRVGTFDTTPRRPPSG